MKNFLRTFFSAVLLLAFTSVPALAQTKIATVDLKKLFDNYYKTKLASQAIQQRRDDLDKDLTSMTDDLKTSKDQYEQLLESADDQAVSDDERARRKKAADDQYKQLQDRQGAIDQFERQAQMTLSDQAGRMHDNILQEIKKVIAEKAKVAGDTMVIDSGAQAISGTPALLYTTGDNDLTDDVLKELNATAPPDLPNTPLFMSTNTLPYNTAPDSTMPATQ